MRVRTPLCVGLSGFLAMCAPAAPPPAKPPSPPKVVAAPTPEHPARWVVTPTADWVSGAHLALDAGTLWVGEGGERWLAAPGKPVVGAGTSLPELLVGVLRRDEAYVFVGASGRAYLSHEPLGAVYEVRPPPHAVRSVAAGLRAIVSLAVDGRVLRSTDGGQTYAQVKVPGDASLLVDVAMSGEQGLLLGMPQRLFRTTDDGASFASLPTLGTGAVFPYTGAHGELVLSGSPPSHLENGALVGKPHASRTPNLVAPRDVVARAFSGTHELSVVRGDKPKTFAFEAQRLVDAEHPVGAFVRRDLPTLDGCRTVRIAVHGDLVQLVCRTEVEDEKKQKVDGARLLRSLDGGVTFVEDGTITESVGSTVPLVGPEGFLLIPSECTIYPSKAKPKPICSRTLVRAKGAKGFTELATSSTPDVSALDAKGGAVLFLSHTSGELTLEQFGLDGTARERLASFGPTGPYAATHATLSVDADGIVVSWPDGGKWLFRRSVDGGKTFASSEAAMATSIARAGKRLLVTLHDGVLESADLGATFTAGKGPRGAMALGCNAFGCLTTRGARLGWDLPDPPPHTKEATAVTEPPPETFATALVCAPKEPWVEAGLGELPTIDAIEPTAQHALASARRKADDAIDLVLTDRAGKTTVVPLLGPAAKGPLDRARTLAHVFPAGVVAVRYRYQRKSGFGGGLSPVHADLAWYAYARGKVERATIPAIGTFRVQHDPQGPRSVAADALVGGAITRLDASGLWFRPGYADRTIRLFGPKGGVERIEPPEEAASLDVARLGDGWTFFDRLGTTSVWSRKDAGGPYTERTWTLWNGKGDETRVGVTTIDGKPHLRVSFHGDGTLPPADFAVGLGAGPDPGPVVTLPQADSSSPCLDAKGERTTAFARFGARHPVQVKDADVPLLLTDEAVVRTAQGKSCLAAYHAETPPKYDGLFDYVVVASPGALDRATLYRADLRLWPAKIATRALACAWKSGP